VLVGQTRSAGTTPGPSSPLVRAVSLVEQVEACAARARAGHPGVAIQVLLASEALRSARVNVCAGEQGFARALGAMLSNACEGDGTRAASRVLLRLGAEAEVDAVSLEIADDGPGIAERELPRLLKPFESTKPGHVGVGLYTARCILEASGGSVRCQNEPGKGTRLTLFLPAAPEARG
jgi:two-component system C4-dicarboxylate transport sensor histidine kinase DctB